MRLITPSNVVNFMTKDDPRTEVGSYAKPEPKKETRPNIPWANDVLQKKEVRQSTESPLKQWWLEQEAKKASPQGDSGLP